MYNKDYYPTPDNIIIKMITPYRNDIRDKTILEPSAGTGSILDVLCQNYGLYQAKPENVYCIESDPELRAVLADKGYQVIHDDFLSFDCQYKFDLIVMNPPFSNGDEHLLKAWDIMGTGDIVCLLNAETINNPYTERRKLLKNIIEDNGSVEMLGDCFSFADRKTGVNVAMVRLHKEEEKDGFKFDFIPDEEQQKEEINFGPELSSCCDVAVFDKIGTYLHAYESSKKAFAEYLRAFAKLKFYTEPFFSSNYDSLVDLLKNLSGKDASVQYNQFINKMKANAWGGILNDMNLSKYMTNDVRKRFNEFRQQQSNYDLTRQHIADIIMFIAMNKDNILGQSVVDVFDIFTKYYKENRMHVEGWKTNDAYKVNRKIILPMFIHFNSWNTYYSVGSRAEYTDIDKAMCFLTGKDFDSIRTIESVIQRTRVGDSSLQESEFFQIRCYKKGTVHFIFKDEKLWERFNLEACKGKNWLGADANAKAD